MPLARADLDPDPHAQFRAWFHERAQVAEGPADAVALATASADGVPTVRMVLLKAHGPEGYRFFTNTESTKGRQLADNPRAALLIYDPAHGRQIRVEGTVTPAPADASDAYWASRPRGSRVSAAASAQSRPVADRATMEAACAELTARYRDREVPRPAAWQGYDLHPTRFEFWEHRDDRLHDRFRYDPAEPDGWRITRRWP